MTPLRIATRGSALALWQARWVADRLRTLHASLAIELVELKTMGDEKSHLPLVQIGGQGAFTKEIQLAVLRRQADVAVHSLKDLPTEPIPGLRLAAIPERGPVGEAFLSKRHRRFVDLPPGATVATGSPRRRALLLHRRPDLKLVEVRGNIDTRLRKMSELGWDGMILAEAGLTRLGWPHEINEILDPAWMLPAVGQGALAIECREDDEAAAALVAQLHHAPTGFAVTAERAYLLSLGGGCMLPTGAIASVIDSTMTLQAVYVEPSGRFRIDEAASASIEEAIDLGQRVAGQMQSRLAAMNSTNTAG